MMLFINSLLLIYYCNDCFNRVVRQETMASGIIQSILKEGDTSKLTEEEQSRICSILCTAEYCVETTLQLQDKLKEKVDQPLAEKIDLNSEHDLFLKFVFFIFFK